MVSPVRLFLRGLHHFLLADMRQSLDYPKIMEDLHQREQVGEL